jgi:hypothetical protein
MPKKLTKTRSRRPVERLVRRLRDIANQIDQMCAKAEKSKAFEHAGIGGDYLCDASNEIYCAINDLTPNK